MTIKFKNGASDDIIGPASTLASGVAVGAVSMTVAAGTGDRFPVVESPHIAYVTLQNATKIEIIKITERLAAADTMTIVKAQEGTTDRAWLTGDVVSMRLTAAQAESGANAQAVAAAALAAHEAAANPHPDYVTTAELAAALVGEQDADSELSTLAAMASARAAELAALSAFIGGLLNDADAATARATLGAAGSGAVTGSGLTQATGKLLGRLSASTGAIEELTVNDFTEDTAPDVAADFVLTYDVSAGAMKKVKPENLVSMVWEEVPLQSGSFTAVPYLDLDLHEDVYCEWKLEINGIRPATDDAQLQLRPLYASRASVGGSYTSVSCQAIEGTSVNIATIGAVSTYPLLVARGATVNRGVGNAVGEHANVVATFGGIGSAASGFAIQSKAGFFDTSGTPCACVIDNAYAWDSATARLCDGVRIIWSAGSLTANGTYKLYGLRRA